MKKRERERNDRKKKGQSNIPLDHHFLSWMALAAGLALQTRRYIVQWGVIRTRNENTKRRSKSQQINRIFPYGTNGEIYNSTKILQLEIVVIRLKTEIPACTHFSNGW